MKISVKKINAFTNKINGGNPAGFVFNPPNLTDKQMTYISKVMDVSETAFIIPDNNSDYKVRFFSPQTEVDLCGHATIASYYAMAYEGLIKDDKTHIIQKTNIGNLPVDIIFSDGKVKRVMMQQKKAIFKDIYLDTLTISDALNISNKDIDTTLPKKIVSTGLFTLPICVKSFEILKNLNPNFEKIKKISKKLKVGSFHVFTFETIEPQSMYHARCFAPMYGIKEDPVTGTANGALSAYLVKNKIINKSDFICEQGDIIGRSGRVHINITGDNVKVGGIAKIVEDKIIEI